LSSQDVGKLPQNFGVTNFLPILKLHSLGEQKGKKIDCENCHGKKSAVGRCNDCCVFMCSFCISAHQRIQSLKNHRVITLQAVKRAEPHVLAKQLFCPKHEQEPLKLFCESCHALICRDCTIFEHRDHVFKTVEDIIERESRGILIAIRDAAEKIPTLESTLKDVTSMKMRVKEKAASSEKDVDVFIDTQIRVLQQLRTELKQGVETVCKAKLHSIRSQEEHLSQHLANIKHSVQFARQAIRNGSESEVLSLKGQMVSRLTDLSEKLIYPTPYQDDGIAVRIDKDRSLRDLIPKLVRIESTTAVPSLCSLQVVGGEPGVIYTTFCGQFCDFIITLRDHFGQQLAKGGNRVQAAITDCPLAQKDIWGTSMRFLDVKDNENGKYGMSYLPMFPGKYILAVAVDSSHIRGSPFCWYVSQKIVNINRCNLEYAAFSSDKGMYQSSSTTIDDIVIDGEYCFSWRVKFRSNLYTSLAGDPMSPLRSYSHSLASQQSFFQGCKIGVKKCDRSLTNSEMSLASACGRSPSSRGSYTNWREMTKDSWFWCDGYCYSPDDPTGTPSNITTFEDGDIFVLFLNPVKKTLIIYNRESGKEDSIENIECPVRPYLKD
jgi:hypothetical protein